MRYADNHCTYEEQFENGTHFYRFTGKCVVTGKSYSVDVPADGLFAYRRGAYMQTAFPNMPADDREFLMSGMSPEGWKLTFGGEDEDTQVEGNEDGSVQDQEGE